MKKHAPAAGDVAHEQSFRLIVPPQRLGESWRIRLQTISAARRIRDRPRYYIGVQKTGSTLGSGHEIAS